jgi:hypothetical protein
VTGFAYALSDTAILAKRSILRIRRQPDLLVGFTIQPIMFVLLFVYVFGGAIATPGLDYVDFLMPGIIVQSMVFGGFVTALGLAEDLKKVGLLWLGEEFAQLNQDFCTWNRSRAGQDCSDKDINRSAFVAWIDCAI